MDTTYFSCISSPRLDPIKLLEMQAQYLRYLAAGYGDSSNLQPQHTTGSFPNLQETQPSTLFDSKEPTQFKTQQDIQESFKPSEQIGSSESKETSIENSRSCKSEELSKDEPIEVSDRKHKEHLETDESIKSSPEAEHRFISRSDYRRHLSNPDEVPIKPSGKTFESLLEEEMKRLKEIEDEKENEEKPKHNFLKKGSKKKSLISLSEERPSESKENIESEQKEPSKQKFNLREYIKRPISDMSAMDSQNQSSKSQDLNEELAIKLKMLQSEMDFFKRENVKLKKLAKELDEKKILLEKAVDSFDDFKQKEQIMLVKWKNKETEKLKKEREALSKRSVRKENEEIERLRETVIKLNEIIKEQDIKHRVEIERLKSNIEKLSRRSSLKLIPCRQPKTHEANQPQTVNISLTSRTSPHTERISAHEISIEKSPNFPHNEGPKIKVITFSNGTKKETHPDGRTIIFFINGDVKTAFPDGKSIYYFADANTTQITYADGLQEFKFANGQVEKHFKDGSKQISFPDGTLKCVYTNGEEESIFPDGAIQRVDTCGNRTIVLADGRKEIICSNGSKINDSQVAQKEG